jgi:O-antigen ligase
MSATALVWLFLVGVLAVAPFKRASYAVGLYMLTFLVFPEVWWWGDEIPKLRWNFFAGVILLFTLSLARVGGEWRGESPFSSRAVKVIIFMMINIALVHVLFAANAVSSMEWLTLRYKFILLFFMLQFVIDDEKDFRIALMSITLGMAYIGYEATINERGSFSGGRLEGIGAAGVTSSNQLSSLLITGLPLTTALILMYKSKVAKVALLACAAMTFNVVLFCNSRGAFLGVVLGGLVFLWMAKGPARKTALRVAALGALGIFLLLNDPEITQRFMTTFVGDEERDTSAQSRMVFWSAAARMIADHPFGTGGNGFSEGYGYRYLGGSAEFGTRAIHNGFITEMASWGIQGFVLFLLFLGVVWQALLKARRFALERGDAQGVLVLACMGASLAAWMMSSVFGDYLDDEWGFWTAALSYAYIRLLALRHGATAPVPAAAAAAPHRVVVGAARA